MPRGVGVRLPLPALFLYVNLHKFNYIVKITKENLDSLNAIIKLEVKQADYLPKIDETLKNYRKRVDIKGFRKGHAPMGMVRKMYGNQVLAETVNDVLHHAVNDYIVDNKLDILGNPLPKDGQQFDITIDETKDFDFEYEIGFAPEFTLDYLEKTPTIEREVIKIDKKLIDEEVERMQKRYGKVEPVVDKMEDDDMLTVLFEELDEEGNIKEGGIKHSAPIALDMIKDSDTQKAVKKLKKDEAVEIDNLALAFDKTKDQTAKQLLGLELTPENLPKVKATLQTVKRVIPAEINEEFLQNIYGKDSDVKTEEDLRKKIEEDIAKYFDSQSDSKLYNKLAEELIEKTKMDFPDTFLKRWIKLTNEKPIPDEKLEEEYPSFAKNLKWSLIVKKVSKENNVDVSMEEVRQRTADQIRQQMMQYGLTDLPEAEMKNFVDNMMAKKDHASQTRETLLEEKLFDYFKKQIKTKDKKVTLEEFQQQGNK